jgi:hypothetical protein
MNSTEFEIGLCEIKETNAHLRANTAQFVAWFSIFMLLSYFAAFAFVAARAWAPNWSGFALTFVAPAVVLILHILAFAGIAVFRRYAAASHCFVSNVGAAIAGQTEARSPVPARFYKWMTNLMAAGYLVSYFVWLALLIFH